MLRSTVRRVGLAVVALGVVLILSGAPAHAQKGGGGGSVDTIRVGKCEYADVGAYVELLIKASSSNTGAHLYAYLPSGELLGEVQNGGGGQYGGTVFVTLDIPESITIMSSGGGAITAPCVEFQP
jgi:hypothetical protein